MSRGTTHAWASAGLYPERAEKREAWAERMETGLSAMAVPWIRPHWDRFEAMTRRIGEHGRTLDSMTDAQLMQAAREAGMSLRRAGFGSETVARSFALVREAAWRRLAMRHFDVQLAGGMVLLDGMVAEMETGEGKTLTATLPACTAALAGVPVHIVTVNDYLAERDATLMGPVYAALGLSVAVIRQGLDPAARRAAYACDVTYCTNKELAFDYLKDRIVMWDRPSPMRLRLERLYGQDSRANRLLLRGLRFAIVDEADSVLIDEARTPLIISADSNVSTGQDVYRLALDMAMSLTPGDDFVISESERSVELRERGRAKAERFDWAAVRALTNVPQREELIRQGLTALHLFERDRHYLVRDGKVQIIDEYTGRLMPDRSWERGLHQLIELKEDCQATSRKDTLARISFQRFFRRYIRLAGMTGTAREVARELWSIYRLRVVTLPTNRPLRRRGLPDRTFTAEDRKWAAVVDTIGRIHATGRPILVGTRSVAASERLSGLLDAAGLPHRVLNAQQDRQEAEIVAQAGQHGQITVATNMAGRGTDIRLGEGVAELGGLHVVGTEHSEARRIDRQLFGRCGRQGDPGTFEAFFSLEDELVTSFGSKFLRWPAVALLRLPLPLGGQWAGRMLARQSQWTAERLHARMRRNLMKMDTQMEDALAFSGRLE
jgi:preprotein translocase subunit SecA